MSLPAMIDVISLNGTGGPEVLVPAREAMPEPAADEVLIAVEAAAVNRPDILQRLGLYPSPPGWPNRPGLDVAGRVAAKGAAVDRFALGDPVCALLGGGGYASHVVCPQAQVLPVPQGLTMIEAAALPETFFTVWTNVFERGALKANEVLLVHGGASGIGTVAVQLGAAFGAKVFATCAGPKRAAVEALGATRAIDYRSEDWVDVIKAQTDGYGVDVILDMVGGDYFPKNLELLALDGRVVQIAFLRGPRAEIDLNAVMRKRLTITGSTLRSRTVAQKGDIARRLQAEVWPLLASGRIKPLIDSVYPLAQAAEAHRHLEAGEHIGKVVLTLA